MKIRFQREPASTGSEEPATAPSSSAELVEYSLGSKSARGNLENFLNGISTTLATRVTRKLPLPHHAKPPANRISQKPGVLIWQNICPLKQKRHPARCPNYNTVLSHLFARGSQREALPHFRFGRLWAKRPSCRAEPKTRANMKCGRASQHRQVRPPRQGGRSAKKRPLRAERPVLPRPRAAVLSARWGLTAEFGMGSGDPPLHGSARGRRSRGNCVPSEGPGDPPRHPGGCMRATRPSMIAVRSQWQ